MTPTQMLERFVRALNEEYTKRGVNGAAAIAAQNGSVSWVVQCVFEAHDELYEVFINGLGEWTFFRLYRRGEL